MKTVLLLSAVLAFMAQAATSVSLNGEWRLDYFPQPDDGALRELPIKVPMETVQATVPGNCELDLVKAGVLPQPELGMNHKLMVGIDVMKDFGASPISRMLSPDESSQDLTNKALFREMTLYYMLDNKTRDGSFEMYAGIFPRKASEGGYSDVFFSDSLKFYDNNLEGVLLKLRRPKAYFELGCDWMGQYSRNNRERFMVFSSGEGKVAPCLSLGYDGYMYHFASSEQVVCRCLFRFCAERCGF